MNLFLAGYYGDQLVEVPTNSGVPMVTLASGLDGPEYLAVDPQGDVYVANVIPNLTASHRILVLHLAS